MNTTLDGQKLFDERELRIEIASYKRDSIERNAPLLDGIISIDLGRRSRTIRQTDSLRAKSCINLNEKNLAISNFMDGNTHTLVNGSSKYQNLRMDSFKITGERTDGAGMVADYEITYTQLA